MSGDDLVTFSVVDIHEPRDQAHRDPAGDRPDHATRDDALPLATEVDDTGALPFDQQQDVYTQDNFPLAGPILERANVRELKGRCGNCDAKLRIKVRQQGHKRVRCPICGHTRDVHV